MRVNRTLYNAAKTRRILDKLPSWIDKSAGTRLFKWLNILGREGELIEQNLSTLKDALHPFYMNPDQPTNIKRVDDIPKGTYQFRGKKDLYEFPLTLVEREEDFIDNLPTRLSEINKTRVNLSSVEGLNLRYIENLPGGVDGFVLITAQHPIDSTFFNLVDTNGNILSSSNVGQDTQSYDVKGFYEEVRFEDNTAELRYQPIWKGDTVSTIAVYDVLNLTNGQPTDVTANVTLSGKTLTWTGANPPEGRYIAEYDYSTYDGIRSIIPNQVRWDIGYNYAEDFTDVSYLENSDLIYSPDINTILDQNVSHQITGTNRIREATIIKLYQTVDDQGVTKYYLQLNPLEVRAGRTVTVKMVGGGIYSQDWLADSNLTIDMTTVDSNFIETSPTAIQIFVQGTQQEITEYFIRSIDDNGVVTIDIDSNSPYYNTNVTINIYYNKLFTDSSLVTTNDTESMEINGESVYYSRLEVTSLIDQSMTIPEVDDFTIEVPQEFVAKVQLPVTLLIGDEIQNVEVYLERFNQALHFNNTEGSTTTIYLLNLTMDTSNNIHQSDILSGWDYRDMILKDDHLYILRTLVDTSSGDYLQKAPSSGGRTAIDLWNIYSRRRDMFFEDGLITNAVSLTLGPQNTLYILALIKDPTTGNYENWIFGYRIAHDYIYLVDKGDTYTAFIREDIDELLVDDGN